MNTANSQISNSDNVIDSRDVIARIEELQEERDGCQEAITEAQEKIESIKANGAEGLENARAELTKAVEALAEWEKSEEAEELAALLALQEEAEGYAPDWKYGCTLVRDSYFTDYCEELVKDIGDLPKDIPGYLVIDWEATAENLKADYTSVEFDGVEYWVR